MKHRRTARLASWQMHLVSWSGGGLLASGSGWLLLHYFGQRAGDFGPEMNPLEPWMLKLHGLLIIPALMAVGGMFVAHIPKGWDQRRQRVPGIVLCALLAALIVTGYLLYYAGGETLREWTSVIHWIIGLTLPLSFLWHYFNALTFRRQPRSPASARKRRGDE